MNHLAADDKLAVLRFASMFLWADLDLADRERRFFRDLAGELGYPPADIPRLEELLEVPEPTDPTTLSPALAGIVRDVALRAIASDGVVDPAEMELFHLLDELLPP